MSATHDSTLADPQQVIADLRRANDELRRTLDERTAERDEALQRETATAEVLQVINSSPGDLAPVFDAILDRALRLCEAAFGILAIYDGEVFRAVALRGVSALQGVWREPLRPTPGSHSERLVRGEPFIHDDLASLPVVPGSHRARMIELGGVRTILWAPLRREGSLVGAVGVYRTEARPFTDRQIAFLQNFAAQAVIAMENARLITETREALEQQTATAEVLGVINSSPGDLAPVFDAMLEKALKLCEASFGNLVTYDGELFHWGASRGHPDFDRWVRGTGPLRPGLGTTMARIVSGELIVHVSDIADEDAYRSGDPIRRGFVEIGGFHTLLGIALRKDDRLLGALHVYRQEVRAFTDKQIALLENFAAQAVIAMENARLMAETREALEQQTATAEVLGVINLSPGDLAPVFDAILEKAHGLCEIDLGELELHEDGKVRAVAIRGVEGPFAELLRQPFQPPPGAPPARLIAGERIVQITDVSALAREQPNDPRAQAGAEDGLRTALFVPLRKDDVLLGYITGYRREIRPFTDQQIALLQNFAAQAVVAMENARLITETREALEQQTATAEVLGVINSSPGDLAPVFDAMLEKATRLCEAAAGTFWVADGEQWHPVAIRGMPEQFVRSAAAYRPSPISPVSQIASGAHLVHLADLAAAEAYRVGDALVRAAVDQNGIRTLLSVPLRKEDRLLGVFSVYRREVRSFTDKQIALVQNFAAQAVIAMENARLITETREALERQTATAEVLGVINSSPGDLAPVFDAILEKAHTLCGAEYGVLLTYDGERFRPAAIHGTSLASPQTMREGIRPGFAFGRLLRGERFIHIHDMAEVAAEMPDDPLPRALFEISGIRTQLAVPLRKDSKLLGIITANRREVRPFSEKQIALIENFAAQAVIAMENARLLGELRQRTEEVAELNRDLEARVAAQLAELERTGKLRRFLAPQLADLIIAQGDESILESHRREIVVVFCDIRGFTAFAERAEPEEVMALLRDYHAALGPIVARFEGTLDHYSGDGVMVFFNDPLPTPEPAKRAIEMAVALREAAQQVLKTWRRRGHDLGFGVGISQGYATLGQIGFAERMDYTAIGTVCNLAARLCDEAKDGQILISRRVAVAVEEDAKLEEIGEVSLKGLSQAVAVYNVVQ